MNQFALLHFTITKNDRLFQVVLQPGTPWPDLEEALEEFKAEFLKAKKEQEDLAAKKQEEKPVEDDILSN
jgi:hypothetical protein